MMYLVDANVVMTAANTYYRHSWVPEFWLWLAYHGTHGRIKMPIEIFEEIKDGSSVASKDELYQWASDKANRDAILLPGEADPSAVLHVLEHGYSLSLTDVQLEGLGRDPFLVAHALVDPQARRVVTLEKSQPQTAPHNRKVPDACAAVGVSYCTPFEMMTQLGFRTSWNSAA